MSKFKTKIKKRWLLAGFLLFNLAFFQGSTGIKSAFFVAAPEKAYAYAIGAQPGADTGGPPDTGGGGGGGDSDHGNYTANDVRQVTNEAQGDIGRTLDQNERPDLGTPR